MHDETPSLNELGINKLQSHRWQLEASIPEDILDDYIIETISKPEELTSSGVIRLAKKLFPAEEFADTPDETLAEWINTGHQAIQMAVVKLTIHAGQVGAWLTVMKGRKVHGEWEGWVDENCLFVNRTARRYMKLYRKLIALPNRTLVSVLNMPVNTAYRHLGVVKTPTDKLEVETPPLPEGTYNVIYADPPWQIAKLRRTHASIGTAAYCPECKASGL